ncbi:Piso0_000804 [Millerozyma farinosa CBS 7064]|uniref:Piso0_000804 protein n=1 Tax=Pichia sorbitophila (strain ATCC MYA-4447 / BCRC 22081 / CBS 7064 / NBRC 10061 / NRRL Y-12695) TaxID=559304 RepID=G8YRK0_PICSO|nr:Piso0_000804 [Millerozyma farinosa CBS 7064]
MSESPIIAYKKPLKGVKDSPMTSKPASPSLGESSSSLSSPKLKGERKVSARRKALQNFYSLPSQSATDQDVKSESPSSAEVSKESDVNGATKEEVLDFNIVNDEKRLNDFLKKSSINDILRLRNAITDQSNSHESRKKSLIYDNYYELIKLSEILGELSHLKSSQETESKGLGILKQNGEKIFANELDVNADYINNTLNDLQDFIKSDVETFTSDFNSIAKNQIETSEDLDSNASIKTVKEDRNEAASTKYDVDLLNEINTILNGNSSRIDKKTKENYIDAIQNCLKKLNVRTDELLIIQLNNIRKKLS